MNANRRRRLIVVLSTLSLFSAGVIFALLALKQNINLYYTPTEIATHQAQWDHPVRVGGLVKKGSVRQSAGLAVQFLLTDNRHDLRVYYTGVLPDLFREGQGIVAEGTLTREGTLQAAQVLAKHDEKYMPKEVSDALQAGRFVQR